MWYNIRPLEIHKPQPPTHQSQASREVSDSGWSGIMRKLKRGSSQGKTLTPGGFDPRGSGMLRSLEHIRLRSCTPHQDLIDTTAASIYLDMRSTERDGGSSDQAMDT